MSDPLITQDIDGKTLKLYKGDVFATANLTNKKNYFCAATGTVNEISGGKRRLRRGSKKSKKTSSRRKSSKKSVRGGSSLSFSELKGGKYYKKKQSKRVL